MNSSLCCCFVPGCVNSKENNTNATFYVFPEELQEEWLTAIGRDRDTLVVDELVCSEHFVNTDFEDDGEIKTLRSDVIPSLNLPTESKEPSLTINSQRNTSSCEDIKLLVHKYDSYEKKPVKIRSNTVCTVLKPGTDSTYKCETAPLNAINAVIVSDESQKASHELSDNPIDNMELSEPDSGEEYYLKNEDVFNCRTCLGDIGCESGHPVTSIHHENKTLKEMIVYCVPQMASTLLDTDLVCNTCLESIKFCTSFIESCLKVEEELLESQDDYFTASPDGAEASKENDVPEIVKQISLDHNYIPETDQVPHSEKTSETAAKQVVNYDPLSVKHECEKCERTFKTKNYLLDHVRRVHSGSDKPEPKQSGCEKPEPKKKKLSTFECDFCDKSFLTKLGYDLHLQLSHREQVEKKKESGGYTCKECGNRFASFGDLTEHKYAEHGYTCTICSLRYNTRKELYAHNQTHPNSHLCDVCGKGFRNKSNLKVHMITHNDPNTHLCHKCGQGFKSPGSLRLHLKLHDPELKFKCDECPSAFQKRYRLNLHKKVRHLGIREYKCTVCDKKFCYKANLQSHYRLKHSEVKPYQCERCGVRFARADYLRRHKNCGEKTKRRGFPPHKRKYRYKRGEQVRITCKLCGKVFKNVQMLLLHVKTHTKLRKYKCRSCNLTFTTSGNRDRHEKVHKEAPFRCEVCFKRLESQEALDEHTVMSHGNSKKYKCHTCGELFGRKYLLHSHVAEKHEDMENFEKEKEVLYKVVMEDYLVDD